MFVSMGVTESAAGDCAVTSPSSVDTSVSMSVIVPILKPAVVIAVLAAESLPASYTWSRFLSGSVFISSSHFMPTSLQLKPKNQLLV
jgi:hypothetical protein